MAGLEISVQRIVKWGGGELNRRDYCIVQFSTYWYFKGNILLNLSSKLKNIISSVFSFCIFIYCVHVYSMHNQSCSKEQLYTKITYIYRPQFTGP